MLQLPPWKLELPFGEVPREHFGHFGFELWHPHFSQLGYLANSHITCVFFFHERKLCD